MRSPWALALVVLLWPTAVFATEATAPTGHAVVLVKMLFVLGGVCLLAFASLKWGLKRFVAPDGAQNAAMRVVGRLPIEPRRSVLVVRVGEKHLVLGSSEAGIQPLAELSPDEAAALAIASDAGRSTFSQILAGVSNTNVSRETSPAPETLP